MYFCSSVYLELDDIVCEVGKPSRHRRVLAVCPRSRPAEARKSLLLIRRTRPRPSTCAIVGCPSATSPSASRSRDLCEELFGRRPHRPHSLFSPCEAGQPPSRRCRRRCRRRRRRLLHPAQPPESQRSLNPCHIIASSTSHLQFLTAYYGDNNLVNIYMSTARTK